MLLRALMTISRSAVGVGGGAWGTFSMHPLAKLLSAPAVTVANDEPASGWKSNHLFPLPIRSRSIVGRQQHNCSNARNGHRCVLLCAPMIISRSAVGVGGGELAGPIGFGVEEGFSAGREGVAELLQGFAELLDAFHS